MKPRFVGIVMWAGALQLLLAGLSATGCRQSATRSRPTSKAPHIPILLTDVTLAAGIHFVHEAGAVGRKYLPETMGAGCAFIDYDHDAWWDILLLNGMPWSEAELSAGGGTRLDVRRKSPTMALYRNNRDGTFTDMTVSARLNIPLYAMGCCVGDYDNDLDEDLYITTALGPNRLFRNTGRGTFEDETRESGTGSRRWGTSCAWLDADGDGWLDLFVGNYVRWTPATDKWCGLAKKAYCRPHEYPGDSCLLYRNNHDGTFADVSKRSGIASHEGKSLGVVIFDYDHDSRPDIAVANDTEPTFLFRNRGHGIFEDVAMEAGVALSEEGNARAGMGIDAADLMNDGQWSLLIGNFVNEGLAFFHRVKSGEFSDLSDAVGLRAPSLMRVTFAVGFVDFDNDGYKDAFAVNGHIDEGISPELSGAGHEQRMSIFHNLREGGFRDVTARAGSGVQRPLIGRGAAWGDFDNDGDVDLLITENQGRPRLLRNDTAGNRRSVTLRLIGRDSNRSAIGARVRFRWNDIVRSEGARSAGSYLSASDPRICIGMGAQEKIRDVIVTWPGGREDRLGTIAAGRSVSVIEGRGIVQP